MPPSLPIELANFPALQTRKALLILDLQNEFFPDGEYALTEPSDFVQRTLAVARAFREAGAGDVFWVRSQFESHRPAGDAHIIVTDAAGAAGTARSGSSSPIRNGHRQSEPPEEDLDADPEAFLSIGGPTPEVQKIKAQRLFPGSLACELSPVVIRAVDKRRDMVLVKSHYSAFESSQLLMRLRTKFVTELYICGALTNVSVYATALDAARHGLALTLIEDCCGYRSSARHATAVRSLVQLTGCELETSDSIVRYFEPQTPAAGLSPKSSPMTTARGYRGVGSPGHTGSSGSRSSRTRPKQASEGPVGANHHDSPTGLAGSGLPVRTKAPESNDGLAEGRTEETETGGGASGPALISAELPSGNVSKLKHNIPSAAAAPAHVPVSEDQPQTQPLQPVVKLIADDLEPPEASNITESSETPKKEVTSTETPALVVDAMPTVAAMSSKAIEADTDLASYMTDLDLDESILEIKARYARLRMGGASGLRNYAGGKAKRRPRSAENTSAVTTEPGVAGTAETTVTSATPEQSASEELPKPAVPLNSTDRALVSSAASWDSSNSSNGSGKDTAEAPEDGANTTRDGEVVASEPMCEGDTIVYRNILPPSVEDGIYDRLRDEVQWLHMTHQGGEVRRLVCVQGEVQEEVEGDGGCIPVYRHPADTSPPLVAFTPTVLEIKAAVEKVVGHPLNHVLIQLYRTGNDHISEHSDKSLDIVANSYVCNVSLGAERTMTFRTKRPEKDATKKAEESATAEPTEPTTPAEAAVESGVQPDAKRQVCRARLPHNSLCRMGLQTNMHWLHAIRPDKRASRDKTVAELAFGGERISLTFRRIGTFLTLDQTRIWGQGARGKTRAEAGVVAKDDPDEALRMVRAFGSENHSSHFDWAKHYGAGFDVLDLRTAARFFASADAVVNMSIRLLLAALEQSYAHGSMGSEGAKDASTSTTSTTNTSVFSIPVRFVDSSPDQPAVDGILAIMLYLDAVYGPRDRPPAETARKFMRLEKALQLQGVLRQRGGDADGAGPGSSIVSFKGELAVWEEYVRESEHVEHAESGSVPDACFVAGTDCTLADFAFWPVLHELARQCGGEETLQLELGQLGLPCLARYYTVFQAIPKVQKVWKQEE